MNIQNIWSNLLDRIGRAWWIEVTTEHPHCVYYFGPFANASAADRAKSGYVEDLENELAQGIQVTIAQCHPIELTIDYDLNEAEIDRRFTPVPI
jgi:Domain of unknown function (DUF1816)